MLYCSNIFFLLIEPMQMLDAVEVVSVPISQLQQEYTVQYSTLVKILRKC